MIEKLRSIVSIPARGYRIFSTKKNKCIKIEWLRNNGKILAISKIARNEHLNNTLINEVEVIKTLKKFNQLRLGIPDIINISKIMSQGVVTYSYIEGEHLSINNIDYINFLQEYVAFQVSGFEVFEADYYPATCFKNIADALKKTLWWPGEPAYSIEEIAKFCDSLCIGFSHNDLNHLNIIKTSNNFYLIDFEASTFSGPCLVDLFCLLFHSNLKSVEKNQILKKYASPLIDSECVLDYALIAGGYWFIMQTLLREGVTMGDSYRKALVRHFIEGTLPI